MSRKSQAYADGTSKFTWTVTEVEHPNQEGRYKCSCDNFPEIYAFGETESQAIRLANSAMETAVDKAEV